MILNKTLQDRLVKEMRERNISSFEQPNCYDSEFIEDFNRKFSVLAKSPEDKHKKSLESEDFCEILSQKLESVISKSLSFQYKKSLSSSPKIFKKNNNTLAKKRLFLYICINPVNDFLEKQRLE